MKLININISDKNYSVKVATSIEEKRKGLSKVKELAQDEGMLFDYSDDVGSKSFHMKDTFIPLDIIFINEDQEVFQVNYGKPDDPTPITANDVAYVLEVNINSGIKIGDSLEFEDNAPVMKVLFPDGSTQMDLWGGERIVSRRETKVLIRKAKKAELTKKDSDYKSLGKYIFKVIDKQDNREPEYVQK